jgi:RNA polymerase sigma-70 factor (ECF subfamily)
MPENVLPTLRDFFVHRYDYLKDRLSKHLGNSELAGDALHDVWLRLEHRDDISGVSDLAAYLLRMAVNVAIDQMRSNSRLLSADEIDELLEYPDTEPGPAETVESRSELRAVVDVIQKMPLRRQQILLMVRLERMPQQEVADSLGVSLRTIEQELKKAHDFCLARIDRPAARKKKA